LNSNAADSPTTIPNVRYLPLVYFLPQELLIKCPTLSQLPRNLSVLSASNPMLTLIDSDAFLHEIMDAAAALAFRHFGFGGWKEHYTGDFPVWRLSYALPLWVKGIEQVTGWGFSTMLRTPTDTEVPFFAMEYVKEVFSIVVKQVIQEQGWQPMLDIIRQMPCDEDFEKWNTNVRISFMRRWYHTRSKKVNMVSLEATLEDGESPLYYISDPTQDVEGTVIAQDYVDRFMVNLSARDQAILKLRMDGFTLVQIAQQLGYANHSAIIKRMQRIQKRFEKYREEQNKCDESMHGG